MGFMKLFKEDSYGTFYFWQFITGSISMIASLTALVDFYLNKSIKYVLAPYIALFALGMVFLILFLKYRRLYHRVVCTSCTNGHIVAHNCLNTFFELQRILHKDIIKKRMVNIDNNRMGEVVSQCIQRSIDLLAECLSHLSGCEVYTTVKLFDVNEKIHVQKYTDIFERNIGLRIVAQSSNTPDNIIRQNGHKHHTIQINGEADYLCLLKQNWNWHYICDMTKFIEAVDNSKLHSGRPKIDTEMAGFTKSKIIVPIRCEKDLTIIGKEEAKKEIGKDRREKPPKFDFVGFLVAYSNERNSFRPKDEKIYCNYLSLCADSLFKLFERIRTYQRHSECFVYYENGHRQAKVSDEFMNV